MSTNSELKELMKLFITERYKLAHYLAVASLVKKMYDSPPETLPELLYQLMLSKDPNMLDGMKKKLNNEFLKNGDYEFAEVVENYVWIYTKKIEAYQERINILLRNKRDDDYITALNVGKIPYIYFANRPQKEKELNEDSDASSSSTDGFSNLIFILQSLIKDPGLHCKLNNERKIAEKCIKPYTNKYVQNYIEIKGLFNDYLEKEYDILKDCPQAVKCIQVWQNFTYQYIDALEPEPSSGSYSAPLDTADTVSTIGVNPDPAPKDEL